MKNMTVEQFAMQTASNEPVPGGGSISALAGALAAALTEMVAGLEIARNKPSVQRQKMFYWEKKGNSVAEIDYLEIVNLKPTPIEVKSGTQGGMKSLWLFMREKHLTDAIRCSLENFGEFEYIDNQDNDAVRYVRILPLYAISQLS